MFWEKKLSNFNLYYKALRKSDAILAMKDIKIGNQRGLVKVNFQSIPKVMCLCYLCDFKTNCN